MPRHVYFSQSLEIQWKWRDFHRRIIFIIKFLSKIILLFFADGAVQSVSIILHNGKDILFEYGSWWKIHLDINKSHVIVPEREVSSNA